MEKDSKPGFFKNAQELAKVIDILINNEAGFKEEDKEKSIGKKKKKEKQLI